MNGGPSASAAGSGAATPVCPLCRRPAGPFARGNAEDAADSWHRVAPGGRRFVHVECGDCALIFTTPTPTDDELRAVYESRYDYAWFQARRALKRIQARHRFRRVRALLGSPGGRAPALLDIGAGQGHFVEEARRAGWNALGLDPALPESVPGFRDELESGGPLPGGPYEAITLWHALEHMRDPAAVLGRVHERLVPGGVLIVAVPNRNARGLAMAGRGWGWFQEPFVHLWHWSPEALVRTLPPGFSRVHCTTRDTWDQQTFFATRFYGLCVRVGRGLGRLAGTNRTQGEGPSGRSASVWAREALHIAGYAAYCARRAVLGDPAGDRLERSELLLSAVRGDPSAAEGTRGN